MSLKNLAIVSIPADDVANNSATLALQFRGMQVTSASDAGADAAIGSSLADDTADGDGLSLREAAAWMLDGDVISVDPSINVITLSNGAITIAEAGSLSASDLTLTAGADDRHLIITAADQVAISGIHFTGGDISDTSDAMGVITSTADVSLTDCNLSNNTVTATASSRSVTAQGCDLCR